MKRGFIMSDKFLQPFQEFALTNIAIGIHAIDIDGKTIIYNKKMKEIEGLNFEDIQDRTILELFNFDSEESTLLKALREEKEFLNVKQTYWNRNGIEITTINDTYPIFDNENFIIGAIELARDVTALEKFINHPIKKTDAPVTFNQIVAESPAMKKVVSTARKAAESTLPVILIGNAGTGKQVLAESIHNVSTFSNRYFYTLHCSSSDQEKIRLLVELVKTTANSTLFSERIDLLSIPLQEELFNALSKIDIHNHHLIASISDDPVDLIASGVLLKDLYYLFASISIRVPPLHKRKEDIIPFINNYLNRRRDRFGTALAGVTSEVEQLFLQYDWPGNLREIEFLLDEITSTTTTETVVTHSMLPLHFRMKTDATSNSVVDATHLIMPTDKEILPLDEYLRAAEAYYLEKAMKLHHGNITKTATGLGMSRQNLQYRLRKFKK